MTPGFTFAAGVRDTPVRLHPKNYISKLNELRHKFLVFWDVTAKRGWLVNGLDGLLHLLRATLKHYETVKFMSQVLESKSEKILEPPSDPDTYAFNLLRNEENMKLPIIPDKDIVEAKNGETEVLERKKQFVRLEELVEELYGNLEVLIDHQVEKAGQSGVRIKSHARRRLEG